MAVGRDTIGFPITLDFVPFTPVCNFPYMILYTISAQCSQCAFIYLEC